MKHLIACLVVAMLPASGWSSVRGPVELGVSAFADTEISTNIALAAWSPEKNIFEYSIDFNATPSNNVQIAFGTDADADGILSVEETEFTAGWSCGRWFATDASGARVRETAPSDPERKKLHVRCRLDGTGAPKSFSATDGLSSALSSMPLSSLYSAGWNIMRLTARGTDDHASSFAAKISPDGFLIMITAL